MARILVVTNDFPPTLGGIQSYLRDFIATLNPQEVVVFASTQNAEAAREYDALQPYSVVRWPGKMMLPTIKVAKEMQRIIRDEAIEVVWFGAAAPLAVMASWARQAGAKKIIASTHGHEVGWSMLPGTRQALRIIGRDCDIVTYISEYTKRRFQGAFGRRTQFVHLPSGVEVDQFVPVDTAGKEAAYDSIAQYLPEWSENPLIVCISRLVPRKGQDILIQAMAGLRKDYPSARLVIVGGGSDEKRLRRCVEKHEVDDIVTLTGKVSDQAMLAFHQAADIFAMPARTRAKGLDVEGLGIVYLEAQACAKPVIAGDSGGAPETVTPESGIVVHGRNVKEVEAALRTLLADQERARAMGEAGRQHVLQHWDFRIMAARLQEIIAVD